MTYADWKVKVIAQVNDRLPHPLGWGSHQQFEDLWRKAFERGDAPEEAASWFIEGWQRMLRAIADPNK
jgi:hypothetical protein